MQDNTFKVGDWVRRDGYMVNIGRVVSITPTGDLWTDIYLFNLEECVLWVPQSGEWCWFWNEGDKIPVFAQLVEIKNGKYYCNSQWWSSHKYCKPFIGALPINEKGLICS